MENAMVAMIHSFMRMWQSLKQFSDPSCTPIDASLHPVRSPGQPAGARIVKYLVHTCMCVCVHAQNVASWVQAGLLASCLGREMEASRTPCVMHTQGASGNSAPLSSYCKKM